MNPRIIVKKIIPKKLFKAIEPIGHLLEALLWNVVYGFPAHKLKVIGVTGTDGKTTTSITLYRSLNLTKQKTALLSTALIDLLDGKSERPSPTHLTTASSRQLLRQLKIIAGNKPDYVVLEVSSHALAQHRVFGVPFSGAIITNLSHEHLDYHGNMERYARAKRRLFELVFKNKRGLGIGVSNADDNYVKGFALATPNPITYGIDRGDIRAKSIKLSASGSSFVVKSPKASYNIETDLIGRFNVYNCLAVISVLEALGMSKSLIEQSIKKAGAVNGRMTIIRGKRGINVIIDYAVTPKALESALSSCRELTSGMIALVFGATGDRDKSKRPQMGRIASRLADRVYLTDDETHTEDPQAIRNAVMVGIKQNGGAKKVKEFDDRAEAIKTAIREASSGDIVLITGLGHQTDRNMGGKLEPWSDIAFAKEVSA